MGSEICCVKVACWGLIPSLLSLGLIWVGLILHPAGREFHMRPRSWGKGSNAAGTGILEAWARFSDNLLCLQDLLGLFLLHTAFQCAAEPHPVYGMWLRWCQVQKGKLKKVLLLDAPWSTFTAFSVASQEVSLTKTTAACSRGHGCKIIKVSTAVLLIRLATSSIQQLHLPLITQAPFGSPRSLKPHMLQPGRYFGGGATQNLEVFQVTW